MQDKLLVRLHPDLKALVIAEVDRLGIDGGMGELAVRILAEHFGRPDLAKVPRKRMGRPPGAAKNGANGHQGKRNGKVAKAS